MEQGINKVINRMLQQLRVLYKQSRKNFSYNAIHDFRVEVKKLRSLFCLLNAAVPEHWKFKLPKHIKQAYQLFGQLRNIEIIKEHILTKNETIEDYFETVLAKESKLIHKKIKALPKIKWTRFFKSIKKNLPQQISTEAINTFVKNKMIEVKNFSTRGLSNDDVLHTIRKALKDVQYVLMFHLNQASQPLQDLAALDYKEKELSILNQYLGEYNNLVVTQAFLQRSSFSSKSSIQIYKTRNFESKKVIKRIFRKSLHQYLKATAAAWQPQAIEKENNNGK